MEQMVFVYKGGILYGSYLIITLAAAAAVCGFIIFYLFSDADFRKSNIFYHNKKQKSIGF